MFSKTYKATMKTIFRSPLAWAAVAVVLGVAVYRMLGSHYGMVDMETYETIFDTDPRFVMTNYFYINMVLNSPFYLMRMLLPSLCVIVSGVVLTRDWSDGFFEVERAGGVKVREYFFGRFLAVFTFVTVAALTVECVYFNGYFITRGLPEDMSLWEYIPDSLIRNLRAFFICVIPAILRVIGFSFLFSGILKNGVTGMIAGMSYAIFIYVSTVMLNIRGKLPEIYINYITPVPQYLYHYWGFYDSDRSGLSLINPFSSGMMLICVASLCAIAAAVVAAAYICVKKRRV